MVMVRVASRITQCTTCWEPVRSASSVPWNSTGTWVRSLLAETSMTLSGATRRVTRGEASSTTTCKVVETNVPVMSSPRPGMLVMEIRQVRDGEDCRVSAEESGTSTAYSPSLVSEPSDHNFSPSNTSTKMPRLRGAGTWLPSYTTRPVNAKRSSLRTRLPSATGPVRG